MSRPDSADRIIVPDLDFQQILTNPILDIAARFWEADRYEAFQVCYRSMRVIDDLVDDLKTEGTISRDQITMLSQQIADWIAALHDGDPQDTFQEQLLLTAERFRLPLWPWERLGRAMMYDLKHDGFATWRVFRRYCEGAAVAPASVFMHLCGVRPTDNRYRAPLFDIRRAARPLALFSYLVHIMRDFEKDQNKGLNYFPHDLLAQFGLDTAGLRQVAAERSPDTNFRNLIAKFCEIAGFFRTRARTGIDIIAASLAPPYQLSLAIVYQLYLQVFERVKPDQGQFSTAALNPSPDDIRERIDATVAAFEPVPAGP